MFVFHELTGTSANVKCISNVILEGGRIQLSVQEQSHEMVEDIQHLIGDLIIWTPVVAKQSLASYVISYCCCFWIKQTNILDQLQHHCGTYGPEWYDISGCWS